MVEAQALVPLLVFFGIVMGIWGVLSALSNRNSRSLERLARLSRPPSLVDMEDGKLAKSNERFQGLADMAKSLSSPLMPKTQLEQNALKTKLANAGFRSEAAPIVYSGIRFASLLVFFLVSVLVFVPGRSLNFDTLKWVGIFTGIGFYLPSIVLWWI